MPVIAKCSQWARAELHGKGDSMCYCSFVNRIMFIKYLQESLKYLIWCHQSMRWVFLCCQPEVTYFICALTAGIHKEASAGMLYKLCPIHLRCSRGNIRGMFGHVVRQHFYTVVASFTNSVMLGLIEEHTLWCCPTHNTVCQLDIQRVVGWGIGYHLIVNHQTTECLTVMQCVSAYQEETKYLDNKENVCWGGWFK